MQTDINFAGLISELVPDIVGSVSDLSSASNTATIMLAPPALTILSKELVEAAIGEMAAVRMVVDVRYLVGVVGILFFIRLHVRLMHNAKPCLKDNLTNFRVTETFKNTKIKENFLVVAHP